VTAADRTADRIQLFSGGLDSLCLWYLTGKPLPVYVRLGHAYQAAELDTLHHLAHVIPDLAPHVIDGPRIGGTEQRDGYIPHRNLTLLLVAATAFPRASTFYLGCLFGEAAPDQSAQFVRAATRALSASAGADVAVRAPAQHLTKTGLVRRFLNHHPDKRELLALTRSCYEPGDAACNRCPACFRRAVALHRNNIGPPPQLPTTATTRAVLAATRRNGWRRLPGLVLNNLHAALALTDAPTPRRGRR
jgi:7-cyano-7-deazaguanine synthase in queuosine biosynthesis